TNDAYLEPARGRPNLTIMGDALVDRVELVGSRATGVRLRTGADWAVVATGDKAAGSGGGPSMAQRAGADIVQVAGSQVIMISQPDVVTNQIVKAIRAVS